MPRRRLSYRATRGFFRLAGGVVPSRFRYRLVVALASALALVMRSRQRLLRRPALTGWTSRREELANLGLRVLDEAALFYTPVFRIDGLEDLAAARGHGTLIIGADGGLHRHLLRGLENVEQRVVPVAAYPSIRIPGSPTVVQTIQRSPTFMIRVRSAFRADVAVAAIVTNRNPPVAGNLLASTPGGVIGVSTGLIHLAINCGASVVFYSSRLHDDGVINLTFGIPSPSVSGDPEGTASEFVAFMERQSPDRSRS